MVSTKFALLATAAVLSEVAVASPHKLLHHVRDEVVTVVRTIYVTGPAAPAATATAAAVPEVQNNVYQETKSESKGTTSSGLSTKRGATFNKNDWGSGFLAKCGSKCGWFHNWYSAFEGNANGASFVPTMWGLKDDHMAAWASNSMDAYKSGSRNFFSFNEPDMDSRLVTADIAHRQEPAQAVENHVKYFSELAAKGDARIATPSVSNSGVAEIVTGLQWLKAFVEGCNANSNCHFDFCNIHYYSSLASLDNVFTHIQNAVDICNTGNTGTKKKVWLTEFKNNDDKQGITNAQKADWLNKNAAKLDALEDLEAWSWYWAAASTEGEPGFMTSQTGELLADGQAFINA